MTQPISFGARLTDLAALHPDTTAIVFAAADGSQRNISWAELESSANDAAWMLHDRGVRPGSFVGVGLPKCPEHFAVTFGAWKVGATVLSLSPNLPEWERTGILGSVDTGLVAADWTDLPGAVGRAEINSPSGRQPYPTVTPQVPIAMCSGGSTGRPKVVLAPGTGERIPGQTLGPLGQYVGLRERATTLITSPMYHNLGFYLTYLGVFDDNRTVVMERFDAARLLDLVESERITWMSLVPTMMQRIIGVPGVGERDFSSLEIVFHTASHCAAWLKQAWIDLIGPKRLLELYGSTEQVGFTLIDGEEWLAHRGSVGRPLMSDLRVLAPDGTEVPTGEVGELFMRVQGTEGPVFEYAGGGQGSVTADGFASIGDLGSVDADGYVYLADRRADLIISGGANVYPAEVEAAILEHPAVADVVVVGLRDAEWGQRVHAILQIVPGGAPVPDDVLRAFGEERLSRYKVPRTWEWLDEFPRNEAGKVRRTKLAADRDLSVVMTAQGPVRGVIDGEVVSFKGIPYAVAERFCPPVTPPPWADIRDASAFGPSAPQSGLNLGDGPGADLLRSVVGDVTVEDAQSEECLVLNVWTALSAPGRSGAGHTGAGATDAKRPVMVWLHGGAWLNSSGSVPFLDGTNLVRRGDVVVVTLNHRLGALGYLHVPEIHPDSGNAGLLDLVAALQWVRANIAAFGGDPGNITIFGESGGGQKGCALLATPEARGLFHKAIVQSGPMLRGRTVEDAATTAAAVKAALGGEDLRTVEVARLIEAQAGLLAGGLGALQPGGHAFFPVVDGRTLPAHPFEPDAPASAAGVPLIIGTTKDEITLYTAVMPGFAEAEEPVVKMILSMLAGDRTDPLYAAYAQPDLSPSRIAENVLSDLPRVGSIQVADRKSAADGAPVWMYLFAYETDALEGLRATHGLDVPFVFDNVADVPLAGSDPRRADLAAAMADAWIAFATTGDPNTVRVPQWAAYGDGRATMVFDTTCEVRPAADAPGWDGIDIPM